MYHVIPSLINHFLCKICVPAIPILCPCRIHVAYGHWWIWVLGWDSNVDSIHMQYLGLQLGANLSARLTWDPAMKDWKEISILERKIFGQKNNLWLKVNKSIIQKKKKWLANLSVIQFVLVQDLSGHGKKNGEKNPVSYGKVMSITRNFAGRSGRRRLYQRKECCGLGVGIMIERNQALKLEVWSWGRCAIQNVNLQKFELWKRIRAK